MVKNVVVDLSKYLNVYQFTTELPGSEEKIEFKPISTFQLKELVSFDGDPDVALDNLINSCVTTEGFNIGGISLQDRFYLLVELRKKSKGNNYNINYDCPACKGQVIDVLDLDKLPVKKIGKLNYIVKLDDNLSVTLKFITRNTGLEATKIVEGFIKSGKYKEQDKFMDEIIMSYLLSIVNVITPAGNIENPDLDTVIQLFSGPASFYDDVVKWYDDLDFGVEFKMDIVCPHCKNKDKIEIPLESFFS